MPGAIDLALSVWSEAVLCSPELATRLNKAVVLAEQVTPVAGRRDEAPKSPHPRAETAMRA
jgi:hypothetical protein